MTISALTSSGCCQANLTKPNDFCVRLAQHKFFASNQEAIQNFENLAQNNNLSAKDVLNALSEFSQLNTIGIDKRNLLQLPRVSRLSFAVINNHFLTSQFFPDLIADEVDISQVDIYFVTPLVPKKKLNKQQFVQSIMQGQWLALPILLFIGIPPLILAALSELLDQPLFDNFIPQGRIPAILFIGFAVIMLQLISQLISSLSSLIQQYFSSRIELETKSAVARRFLDAQSGSFPDRDPGSWRITFSVATAFLNSIESVAVSIPLAIISMLVNLLVVGAFVDFSAIWNLFLILLIPTLASLAISYISMSISVRLIGQQSRLETIIYDVVRQIRYIWMLNLESVYLSRFQAARKQIANSLIRIGMIDSIAGIVSQVFQGALYSFIYYQYYQSFIVTSTPTLSPGTLLVIYFALGTMSGALSSIAQDFVLIAQSLPTYWTPNALRDMNSFRKNSIANHQPLALPQQLNIKELTYTVSDQPFPFPKPISVELETNSSYALIGPSGAGKTTLLRLLVGNLLPVSGKIILLDSNGFELQGSLSECKILYLAQETNFYGGVLRDVVDPSRSHSVDQLEDAASAMNLVDVLNTLPLRWKTPVNEYSRDLSLGQLQLFKISRALLDQYDVILSDEPTCHLPEDRHLEALDLLNKSCKLHLSVLHRMSGLALFDNIIKLDQNGLIQLSSSSNNEVV